MLEATPKPGYSLEQKGIDEADRSHLMKLVINGKGTLKFDVAVVIELIDPDNPVEVGYSLGWEGSKSTLQPMLEWMPSADTRKLTGSSIVEEEEVEMKPSPSISGLLLASGTISEILSGNKYLTDDREKLFEALSIVENIVNYFGGQFTEDEIVEAIEVYKKAKAIYDSYESYISSASADASSLAGALVGVH
jgi:hypothetical protein